MEEYQLYFRKKKDVIAIPVRETKYFPLWYSYMLYGKNL